MESENKFEVDLKEFIKRFVRIIRSRFIFITVVTLGAVVIASVYSFYIAKPVYEAKTTIIIGTGFGEGEEKRPIDTLSYQSLLKTYSSIANTTYVAEKTIGILGLKISPQELQQKITVTPETDTQILEIKVQGDNYEQTMNVISTLSSVFIEEVKVLYPTVSIQAIGKVNMPLSPVKPNKKLNLVISFFMGIIISVFIILFKEYLNDYVKTQEDIEIYLDVPVIGVIPKEKKKIGELNLLTLDKYHQFFMESLRTLRTNIDFIANCNNDKTITVTSCMSGEGKTTTAFMLAIMIARTGKKVILIDCDFRKSTMCEFFSLSNFNGLSDMLIGKIKLEEAIHACEVDNLYVLVAGTQTQNPSELLSSIKLKELIDKLKEEFDYVIIDTPPVGLVTDAQIISRLTDGCLMVVAPGITEKKELMKAIVLLKNVNSNIIGICLNKAVDLDSHNLLHYFGAKNIKKNKKINRKFKLKIETSIMAEEKLI
ncbi:polysaccharide biosynthesis tyrosine autokinase [Clostridium sp.]|uniref:polysaccharide biosynthesis tyrosine autokinase n=1 Tax=Clostridium sp. TaxID=1506 RepID=UPI003D6D2256